MTILTAILGDFSAAGSKASSGSVVGRWQKNGMAVSCLAVSVVFMAPAPVFATPLTLQQTFNNPSSANNGSFGSAFGAAVAIDGGNALVGDALDSTNGNSVGQAHLFDSATGTLLQTFNDPTVAAFDFFGSSVAIDGGNVLISASGDDTNGIDVGQAHLFDATTGGLLQTFDDPTVTDTDQFGSSVAIDGDNVLIGAFADDTNGTNVGQAHLFSSSTGALLQTFNDPTVTTRDLFGFSVAIDGDNVLIGAFADDTNGTNVGQAHLFSASTGALLQTFDDPTVTAFDNFGYSVALDGDNILIGARSDGTNGINVGQAYLFSAATGALLHTLDDPTVTSFDNFGASVAINGDNVLIGANGDDTNGNNVGQAHLFSATTGALLQTLYDPTVTSEDFFGSSVALDPGHALIGAPFDKSATPIIGQAHLFAVSTVPLPGGLALYLGGLALIGGAGMWRRRKT